jgi:hypothetical protein
MSFVCLSLTLVAWPSAADLAHAPAEPTRISVPHHHGGVTISTILWHGPQPRRGRRGSDSFEDDDDSDDATGGRDLNAILPIDPVPAVASGRLAHHPLGTFTTAFRPLIYTFCTLLI